MAITNHERVGKAMELLRQGLAPFVERQVQAAVLSGAVWMDAIRQFAEDPKVPTFGKLHATRGVARTIYLGSAPVPAAARRGIEDADAF